ncbi:MAG: PHP domain-containing protein [Oscillospiraceae bacterium]
MTGDLHCHTTLSDGSLGIEDIILQAKRTGIDFISITDHDTMSSFSRSAVLGERYGVHVLPGVELSAWDSKRKQKVHILCYAPQKPDRLEGICIKSCEIRRASANEMVEKVMKLYPITPESVMKYATGSKSVFKQHIMHALIDYGYTTHFYGKLNNELFDLKKGSCIVEREYPDVNFVL